MNGHKLIPSNFIKYLGIYLDSDLSGKQQSIVLQSKLNRSNGMLAKARHYIPSRELRSLYYAIFSSHMTYSCQIWFNNNKSSNRICKAQEKALRIISFADFHAPSDPLFKTNKILTLKDFITLQNCLFVHDYFHDKLPDCFVDYFRLITDVHQRNTIRNSLGFLYAPEYKTKKYGLNSITRKCPNSWNHFSEKLNCNLRLLSRNDVKTKICNYIFEQ